MALAERKKGRESGAGRVDESRMPRGATQQPRRSPAQAEREREESKPLVVGGVLQWSSQKNSLTPGLSELEPTRGPGRRYQHAAG
jgi:hypothetical protein